PVLRPPRAARRVTGVSGSAKLANADSVPIHLGEPYVAVRTGRDRRKADSGLRGRFPDGPVGGDSPELVPFPEPEIPVRPGRDSCKLGVAGGDGELGDGSGRRDPADLVAAVFREPEVPVRPGRDPDRVALWGRDGELACHGPGRRDPTDLVPV